MQWSPRPETNPRRPIHEFSPNPYKPTWFRVLNGLALPLSVVTLYLAVPMAVLGAISFLLHLALGTKIEPDPGWVVAVVGSAVWTIGFRLSCVAVTKLESWYQSKSRQYAGSGTCCKPKKYTMQVSTKSSDGTSDTFKLTCLG
jgi:hypothetical protein